MATIETNKAVTPPGVRLVVIVVTEVVIARYFLLVVLLCSAVTVLDTPVLNSSKTQILVQSRAQTSRRGTKLWDLPENEIYI